jgi:hypothetical protein
MRARAILFFGSSGIRVPPVPITLHVSERGYRHIRAGQLRSEYTSSTATRTGISPIQRRAELVRRQLPNMPAKPSNASPGFR